MRGRCALFLRKMIEKQQIKEIAERLLGEDSQLFVVEIKCSVAQDIEITLDSDTRVYIDDCATLSKAIEQEFEALGEEDFSLTVTSAGIGYPLKLQRQFQKCYGKEVEIVLKGGGKLSGNLRSSTESELVLAYSEKVAVEGKKRKELVERVETYSMEQIKSVCELLTIK